MMMFNFTMEIVQYVFQMIMMMTMKLIFLHLIKNILRIINRLFVRQTCHRVKYLLQLSINIAYNRMDIYEYISTNLISSWIKPYNNTIKCRKTKSFCIKAKQKIIVLWNRVLFFKIPDPTKIKGNFNTKIFSNIFYKRVKKPKLWTNIRKLSVPIGWGLKNVLGQTHRSRRRFNVSLLCNGITCKINCFSKLRCTKEKNMIKYMIKNIFSFTQRLINIKLNTTDFLLLNDFYWVKKMLNNRLPFLRSEKFIFILNTLDK